MEFKTNSMDVKMVSIGHLNMTLSSFIVLIAGLLLVIITLILSPTTLGLISATSFALVSILGAYNINCAQLGHCQVWAWILTSLYIVGVCLSVLTAFKFNPLKKISIGKIKSK